MKTGSIKVGNFSLTTLVIMLGVLKEHTMLCGKFLEQTDHRKRVVSNLASYSGCPWFKSRFGEWLPLLKFSCSPSGTPDKLADRLLL